MTSGMAGEVASSGSGCTMTILVVEDDAALSELLRAVLNDVPGWGATVVHDASAAREVTRHVKVELLVLDLHLPGISGLELLDLWRADPAWTNPPVVVTTSDPDDPTLQAVYAAGEIDALVPKPFDVDDLVEHIRRVAKARRRGA
jgi:DNA-binding response OmpR family regulator